VISGTDYGSSRGIVERAMDYCLANNSGTGISDRCYQGWLTDIPARCNKTGRSTDFPPAAVRVTLSHRPP